LKGRRGEKEESPTTEAPFDPTRFELLVV